MKNYLINVTFVAGNTERTASFIRRRRDRRPTYRGAARMVAARTNADNGSTSYPLVRPSDISVSRVEVMCYV